MKKNSKSFSVDKTLINNRKKFSWRKYFLVLLITIIIFVSGIAFGSYLNSQKMNDLDLLQRDLTTSTLDNELQYVLLEDEPCAYINSTPVLNELYELSTKLDFMESILGHDHPEVLRLKDYYALLELRYWRFMNNLKTNCNSSINTILYFYSNEGDCSTCEEQGYVLTYIRKHYEGVQVYPFDINSELNSLKVIKQKFDVKSAPTLVIVSDTHAGFMNASNIMSKLKENGVQEKTD